MSARSRARKYIQLPISPRDPVVMLETIDGHLCAGTERGRLFVITKVARYKRPFKVHELKRPQAARSSRDPS